MSDIPADWRGQLNIPAAVYAIRCSHTSRVYVGSSNRPKQRWASHRSDLKQGKHHNEKLQRSYTKYGAKSLNFEILEVVVDLESLRTREQYWIEALHAACGRRGLNLLPTAGSPLGYTPTAETRAKMRAAHIGKSPSAEHRAALSASRKGCVGRPLLPEAIERLRLLHIGHSRKPSPEARAKMSAAKKGKPLSIEHRLAISEAHKRRLNAKPNMV